MFSYILIIRKYENKSDRMELRKDNFTKVIAYMYFALGVHYGFNLFRECLETYLLEEYDQGIRTDIDNFIKTFVQKMIKEEIEENIILATKIITPAHDEIINDFKIGLRNALKELKTK